MRILATICILTLAALPSPLQADDAAEERQIGRMVLEIQEALARPGNPESLEVIARHGTKTSHYVMIRGWLGLELQGVESQLKATRDPDLKRKHQDRAEFLRKAIRRVDLE